MDFIMDLPPTRRGHDALLVIGDRLSKRVILVATHSAVTTEETARLYFEGL